ncbi:MAG: hypothetical protein K2X35_09700 [Bryobacteraceae bacterium]|nr:hypothetical protein [Bryobacteraceae bacterium]
MQSLTFPLRAAIPVFLVCSGAIQAASRPVELVLSFERPPAAQTVQAMRQETESQMSAAQIDLEWRKGKRPGKLSPGQADRVYVSFRGSCDAVDSGEDALPVRTRRLAAAKVKDGHVLPIVEVECENVAAMVARADFLKRRHAVGIALGKVLAHELYHVLLESAGHSTRGLAKSAIEAHELTGQSRLSEEDCERLRRARH